MSALFSGLKDVGLKDVSLKDVSLKDVVVPNKLHVRTNICSLGTKTC